MGLLNTIKEILVVTSVNKKQFDALNTALSFALDLNNRQEKIIIIQQELIGKLQYNITNVNQMIGVVSEFCTKERTEKDSFKYSNQYLAIKDQVNAGVDDILKLSNDLSDQYSKLNLMTEQYMVFVNNLTEKGNN